MMKPTSTGKQVKKLIYSLIFVLLILSFACGTLRESVTDGESHVYHLVVLHTNDTHGHPVKFFHYPAPDVGGLPARATLVKKVREKNENVLLLDAGDINTGRAESNLFKAKPDIIGFNYMGYDAMALGNHEFDNPLSVLKEQMKSADFPFLSANIKTRDGKYLARPYIIKKFKGFKVAVFGLTTKETKIIGNPRYVKDLVFEDEIDVARKIVPELKKEADIVIALVHMGIYPSNKKGSKRLAHSVRGIDLIIDGHTHTRLDSPILIKPEGSDHETIIVQAWKWGLEMGRIDLRIQDRGIKGFNFKVIPINLKRVKKKPDGEKVYHFIGEEIQEDERLSKLLRPYVDKVEAALSEVIGHAEGTFLNRYARKGETALGDMVADSMLWYTKNLGGDFSIQNGGGIRADLPKGPITKKLIYEILPFYNSVVVLSLKGSDIKSLFDFMGAVKKGEGAFPQVSEGVSFTLNHGLGKCENILIKGKPLDTAKTYKVVTNSYLANGGDGYKMFLKAIDRYDSSMFQMDIFIEYIKHLGGGIRPVKRERYKIKND